MKKILLFTALFASYSFGQMTQANEPTIGTSTSMFVCDSLVDNYESITGTGVTWDYSNIDGVFNTTKNVDVLDATLTAEADSFPGATYAINVGGALTSYYSSTATERVSQGFLYFEPSFADPVYAMFSNNLETVATYPFSVSNYVSDNFDGYFNWVYNTLPIHETLTGNSMSTVDGTGTLLLPQSTSIANVLRFKLVDTSYTTLPLLGPAQLVRTQFEYYDYASSNLPVFIHSSLAVQTPGGASLIENNIVLSTVQPTTWVGLAEENALDNIVISPNPASEKIKVEGASLNDHSTFTFLDDTGRIIYTGKLSKNGLIELNDIKAGHYFLKISNDQETSTKNVVIK